MHRFSEAADLWVARFGELVADGRRSAGSLETYTRQLHNHVLPALGEVRLGEATTPLLDKVIATVKSESGAATARTCRSIISGVMGLAVRYGAIPANPVREVDRVEVAAAEAPRALTQQERTAWLHQLRADPQAVRRDLPDLTFFMMATGTRIGEALGVLWSQVDLDRGVVQITHTIVRLTGHGLVRKATKSRAGERVLPLPQSAVAMLRRRFVAGAKLDHPVFPDSIGGFRDPSNVRRSIREARGSTELAWITSHHFRKTTATILDEAALSARQVADQLGHARPSMTQDVYMSRKVASSRAAEALEQALREPDADENRG
jgi:integrase